MANTKIDDDAWVFVDRNRARMDREASHGDSLWPGLAFRVEPCPRFGTGIVRQDSAMRIVAPDAPGRGLGLGRMLCDGWVWVGLEGYTRHDGGFIASERVQSGRYRDRLPTNRKRKRERAKARRRARLLLSQAEYHRPKVG